MDFYFKDEVKESVELMQYRAKRVDSFKDHKLPLELSGGIFSSSSSKKLG